MTDDPGSGGDERSSVSEERSSVAGERSSVPDDQQPDGTGLTAVCHVRAPLLLDPVDAKVETLRNCEASGTIEALLLRSWPAEVSLEEGSPDQEVVARFEEFERWADREGASICPPFRVRQSASLVAEEGPPVLVTPVLCVALYRGDRLVAVYPHSDGDATYSAAEAIATLRTGAAPSALPGCAAVVEPTGPPSIGLGSADDGAVTTMQTPTSSLPETCPDCAGPLANVQGVLACAGCRWNDARLAEVGSPRAKLVYLSLLDEPVSLEALQSALDLNKLSLYGILETLTERGLVEETDDDTYRARRDASRVDERAGTARID